jgi:hypothetical protein
MRSRPELRERAPGYIDTGLDDPKLNPDTVVAAEQRVAQQPAGAEPVVRGSCRLLHGASVAAERVSAHRTDRVRNCRPQTAASSPSRDRTSDWTTGGVDSARRTPRPAGSWTVRRSGDLSRPRRIARTVRRPLTPCRLRLEPDVAVRGEPTRGTDHAHIRSSAPAASSARDAPHAARLGRSRPHPRGLQPVGRSTSGQRLQAFGARWDVLTATGQEVTTGG